MEEEADLDLGNHVAGVGAVDAVRGRRPNLGSRNTCAELETLKHGRDGALGTLTHRGRVSAEQVAQEERDEAEVVVCARAVSAALSGPGGS